ncbi:MAG: hypothetical protein HC806_01155 [Anaerolineae bacterium]|nr:hypothetical protein [Anaerolineae bacterium]
MTKETSLQIFSEQYPQIMKLQRELAKTDWYVRDGWTMFVGYYHAGIFAQVYKLNWHNYTLDGIHLEFGLDEAALESKQLRIDLHVGHRNLFDRTEFNARTMPKMETLVSSWDDVKFSRTNLSDRLHIHVSFTKTGFAKQIATAFTRLSALGPIIDGGIKGL